MRSTVRGWMRPATCELVVESIGTATRWPNSQARKTTAAAPARTMPTERRRLGRSARTMARTMPRMGVISGATIIAPITVAVESLMTPAVAMTAGQQEQHPEARVLPLGEGPFEEELVPHADDVVGRHRGHQQSSGLIVEVLPRACRREPSASHPSERSIGDRRGAADTPRQSEQ